MRAAPRAWINALPTRFANALRTAASTPSTTTLPYLFFTTIFKFQDDWKFIG